MSALKETCVISITVYEGANPLISSLHQLVNSSYPDLFLAVIVHGSIGDGNEIRYSDFDGLLIVKDEAWESPQLASFIRASQKRIFQYDPLQHHGWFMIKESDLKAYPEAYLPAVVLETSALIWPSKPMDLEIGKQASYDFQKSFDHLSDHVLSKVKRGWRPNNMYQLKSFLSEVMLLPCLFLTALDQAPIDKAQSFKASELRFPQLNWEAVKVASHIRADWEYALNPIQRFFMGRPDRFWRKVTEKKLAPGIKKGLAEKLNANFYAQLEELIKQMKQEVKS